MGKNRKKKKKKPKKKMPKKKEEKEDTISRNPPGPKTVKEEPGKESQVGSGGDSEQSDDNDSDIDSDKDKAGSSDEEGDDAFFVSSLKSALASQKGPSESLKGVRQKIPEKGLNKKKGSMVVKMINLKGR
jgi:hypothetical protein